MTRLRTIEYVSRPIIKQISLISFHIFWGAITVYICGHALSTISMPSTISETQNKIAVYLKMLNQSAGDSVASGIGSLSPQPPGISVRASTASGTTWL